MRRSRWVVICAVAIAALLLDVGVVAAADGWDMKPLATSPDGAAAPASGLSAYAAPTASYAPKSFAAVPQLLTPTFMLKWGSAGSANGQFGSPPFAAVNNYGDVFVTETTGNRVQRFSGTGTYLSKWGATGAGPGQFNIAAGICIDRQGYVWVSDFSNSRIQKFTQLGTFIGAYSTGSGSTPDGICADDNGYIYVVERATNRVLRYTTSGAYAGSTGTTGSAVGQFNWPVGIATDSQDHLYVCDGSNNRVAVLDAATTAWQLVIGSAGSGAGQFNGPRGVVADPLDRVWVTDNLNSRVQVFTNKGAFVTQFGTNGSGDGQFTSVWGDAIDGTGFYTVDYGSNRVQKFTLGEAKTTERVGGYDRYEVAVNLAKKRFPSYLGMKHVIIVNGEDRAMADPLGAAQIAGLYNAPVLLTQASTLNPRTKAALQGMRAASGPLQIHVVGGTTSVPSSVYYAIKAINPGGSIERISGSDRYNLSVAMAARAKSLLSLQGKLTPAVLLFNGESPSAFYDALAASPVAARGELVMMAVRRDSVPGAVSNALALTFAGRPRYIVNSSAYVANDTYALVGASGRLTANSNRFLAARDIANWGFTRGYVKYAHAGLANRLPDALTGGSYIGQLDGVLLYSDAAVLPAATGAAADGRSNNIFKGWVFGGTASVTDATKNAFNAKIQ